MTSRNENGLLDGKVRRFFTSLVLPVDKDRTGECRACGACCKFLVECPLLREVNGERETYRCAAYALRPPQCRKYPRTREEQIHLPCGFRFGEVDPEADSGADPPDKRGGEL